MSMHAVKGQGHEVDFKNFDKNWTVLSQNKKCDRFLYFSLRLMQKYAEIWSKTYTMMKVDWLAPN